MERSKSTVTVHVVRRNVCLSASILAMTIWMALPVRAGPGLIGMGDLPGGHFESHAHGVSGDGSVVVGSSASAGGYEPFRWTAATGMIGLGHRSGEPFSSEAIGVSGDGSAVVGFGAIVEVDPDGHEYH